MRASLLLCLAGQFFLGVPQPAAAQIEISSNKVEAAYWGGVRTYDGALAISRFTLKPSTNLTIDENWKADIDLRFELADDKTGLGAIETFSGASKPIVRSRTARLEIDQAMLTYRKDRTRVSLGKQTMAWGVLDGIQVTDRFDPVRRRDFIFAQSRPERISRWGARFYHKLSDWSFDAGISVDPTVSQLARQGDAFSPISPRFRAGIPVTEMPVSLVVDDRNSFVKDATYGVRVMKRAGSSTFSALWFSGPETEPTFSLNPSQSGAISLVYPRRMLIGADYNKAAGPFVLRFEGAYIPDQPLNLRPTSPDQLLRIGVTKRLLAGIGVDWNAPASIFLNFQFAVDHLDAAETDLFAPRTDVFYTIKARRSFNNDLVKVNAELIGSAESGDGAFSADIRYELTDDVSVAFGTNQVFGNASGIFGQFNQQDRVWTRLKVSM